ncbi:DUF6415 family natural product biosynthesis protein [Streptomyces sp. NPDC051079]|uniref:DUF6415 family natural product biosynthesis protein n=1 Tax=Streptomyces sp. NPDC051079 TaxID=3155043 RepID=UPI00344E5728
MRDTTRQVLTLGGTSPSAECLDLLIITLRGHLEILVPAIRALIASAPPGDGPATCARIAGDEAERRLAHSRGHGPDGAYRHASKLALSVNSLCDHIETLACGAHAPASALK